MRNLISIVLTLVSFACPALIHATSISSLHNSIEIQNPAHELAVNELYQLVSDTGANAGLIVITEVDGSKARGDVIHGQASVGQFLRDRHHIGEGDPKHTSATVTAVEHYVTFANADLNFHPGQLYRMAAIPGKESGLVLITEANSTEAQASVLSGDPEPGENLRDSDGGEPSRNVASNSPGMSPAEDIANQDKPIAKPPPWVPSKHAPDHRYKGGLGIVLMSPSAPASIGSNSVSNTMTFAVAGLYNYTLEDHDYSLEFGVIFNEQKYSISSTFTGYNTKFTYDIWYAGLPVEVKYNMLNRSSSSELRLEAGALYNFVLSNQVTESITTVSNGKSVTTSTSTDAKPLAPIDLNLGLEYVLNAKESFEYWADLRYSLSLSSDKSTGPMFFVGMGF